ncbi:MAG TPA: FAD-dependent oxidoreductase [Pirellulales bacterium]|jgi:hypothetical protein|nr:FAD-dependent oxidoreductase [Pirellulales bacterium]
MTRFLTAIGVLLGTAAAGAAQQPAEAIAGRRFDLIVIEATPGGVAMAVRAAREGLDVLLTNHTPHLGGMPTNGLGVWDTLYDGPRSSLFDELRAGIVDHYRRTYGDDSPEFRAALPGARRLSSPRGFFEPHVAEQAIDRMVAAEPKITVLKPYYVAEVERHGRLLRSVTLREYHGSGSVRVAADMFADGSYEGDLLAAARVPYRVGREARQEFDEPHAGVVFAEDAGQENDQAKFPRDAAEGRLNLRPFRITTGSIDPASTGAGDTAIQAFNFRICLTSDPARRILPAEPAGYRREDFLGKRKLPPAESIHHTCSWNEAKLPGANHAYADGDWPTREAITRRHLDYALGWMYFVQNDQSVPEALREKNRRVGLPTDEFTDNDHVPYEMYVREARRLVGRSVFTEHDGLLAPSLGRAPVHADSIAATEWPMDSHECTTRHGPSIGRDGKVLLTEETRPGQVSYRCLLSPEVDNLLVPVCLSTTHIGWGTIRLEPTWMNIAESAGYAAALARRRGQTPAAIDVDELQRTLARRHVMISFFNDIDVASDAPWVAAAEYFGAKGFFADYNVRADEPLKPATAKVWASGFEQLRAGKLDANALARMVAEAEGSDTPADSSPTRETRGAVLQRMFSQLP